MQQTDDMQALLQLLTQLLGKNKGGQSGSGPRKFDPGMMAPMAPSQSFGTSANISEPALLGAQIAGQQGAPNAGLGLDALAILASALRH